MRVIPRAIEFDIKNINGMGSIQFTIRLRKIGERNEQAIKYAWVYTFKNLFNITRKFTFGYSVNN